jgi:hypothetical protein
MPCISLIKHPQGTWQFISAFNLMYPGKQHIIQDDLESFVYVALYHILRYCNHSALRKLEVRMVHIFDNFDVDKGGVYEGGQGKAALLDNHRFALGPNFNFINNPNLNSWFIFVVAAVAEWHAHAMSLVEGLVETTAGLPLGDISHLSFKDHTALGAKWHELLQLPGWPTNDHAVDHLSPKPRRFSSKRGLRDAGESSTPRR